MLQTILKLSPLMLIACVLWHPLALASQVRTAGRQGAAAARAGQPGECIRIDLPAQDLQGALAALTALTGWSGLYGSDSTAARRSAALHGCYLPEAALRMLIDGQDLKLQFVAADAFILEPAPAHTAHRRASPYDAVLQARVRSALCGDAATAPGDFRAALRFRIGATGLMEQVELLDTSGDRRRDAAIVTRLSGLRVLAPPQDSAHMFTMLILPRSLTSGKDCTRTDDRASREQRGADYVK